MTTDPVQIARLVEAAELRWQAWAQALAQRVRVERAAAAAVAQLHTERAEARATANPADPARMRALEQWEAWSMQELARRNMRQATDRAALLRDKADAAVALARREAAHTLAKRQSAEARKTRIAREVQQVLDLALAKDAKLRKAHARP